MALFGREPQQWSASACNIMPSALKYRDIFPPNRPPPTTRTAQTPARETEANFTARLYRPLHSPCTRAPIRSGRGPVQRRAPIGQRGCALRARGLDYQVTCALQRLCSQKHSCSQSLRRRSRCSNPLFCSRALSVDSRDFLCVLCGGARRPSRACVAGESEPELGVAELRSPGSPARPHSLTAEREDYARALRPELTGHTAGFRIEQEHTGNA
ncbi:hypothetical protein MHYP_G00300850 [Metynnis hypsauchen]